MAPGATLGARPQKIGQLLDADIEGLLDFAGASLSGSDLKRGQTATLQSLHWARVTCFQLAYSAVNTGMALLVLPTEAERLNPGAGSLWVGAYLAACGAAQLACPLAGRLSDGHASRWGRRRPFIAVGTFCAIVSFAVMWLASVCRWRCTFLFALLPAQLALNVVFSSQSALPADLRTSEDPGCMGSVEGIVSGIIALHSFLGSLAAMGIIVATRSMDVQVEYPLYMAGLAAACWVVCRSAHEPSTAASRRPAATWQDLAGVFWIDYRRDPNFFWVCVGRIFYYLSTSVVVFMHYYIRDMLGVADEAARRSCLGAIVVSAQLVGALFTVPFSHLSNRAGRKPVIYGACAVMTSTFLLYAVAPKAGSCAWPLAIAAALGYGLGSGAYLSVDYALALDCLPARKTPAEALGVWGVAGFVGSTAGPLAGGALLAAFRGGSSDEDAYGYTGYVLVMLVLGCCMSCLVALATAQIQSDFKALLS